MGSQRVRHDLAIEQQIIGDKEHLSVCMANFSFHSSGFEATHTGKMAPWAGAEHRRASRKGFV